MTRTEPGIYMINATGEMAAIHTESGEGDIQLLSEYVEENNLFTELVSVSGEYDAE